MVPVAASLVLGILAGHYGMALLFASVPVIFSLAVLKAKENKIVKDRRLALIILIILSFLTGIFRYRDTKILNTTGTFPEKAYKDTVITAKVLDITFGKDQYLITLNNPEIKLNEASKTDLGEENCLPQGKVLIYSDITDGARAGDEVYVKGSLYSFQKATNYGQFDQREYYLSRGLVLKLYADEFSVTKRNETFEGKVKGFLFDLSESFKKGIAVCFDEKENGILSAMLTGDRSELDDETKNLYQRMGIAHVLCISGLHITLIGMAVFRFLRFLSGRLKFSIIITCIIVFMYGMLTGFSVSTSRAVIMLFCMLLGKYLGEAYDGQSAGGLAAIIILVSNPLQLFESGFQLSFVAVFGIFGGNEISRGLDIKNKLLLYLIPGISAQLATLPIILKTYYSFSPYSFIANILLLPFMPIIVVSGFISGICGAVFAAAGSGIAEIFSELTAGPAHYLLKGYEISSTFLLKLPGADIITGCPEFIRCITYYIIIFLIIYVASCYKPKKDKAGFRAIIFSLSVLFMLLILLLKFKTCGFYTSFIDVGQGLSVYMEADGICILADGGSSNVKNVGKYRIEPYLLWKGTGKIDICFISHTDEDHISGIKEIIDSGRITIENLVLGCNNTTNEPLVKLATDAGINVIFVEAGDIIDNNVDLFSIKDGDNIKMKVLSPDPDYIYEDKNQASLVLHIKYNEFSMLFTGDSDEFAEYAYLRQLESGTKVNVLQCPHHGSKYSCSKLLLDSISPDIAVISCSRNNIYGHPADIVLERLEEAGSEVYVTKDNGMVNIAYDGNGTYTVDCYTNKNY